MAQLSKVHPGAEGVVAERVPRGPFIKPPAMRSLLDTVDIVGVTRIFGISKKTRRVGSEIAPAVRPRGPIKIGIEPGTGDTLWDIV